MGVRLYKHLHGIHITVGNVIIDVNKAMCLAANLSWHLLKHFLNIKQINKQSNCQSINDDDSSMY
jgi:hypothetical protein